MAAAVDTTFRTGHVGINVTDLARSTQFYRDVFGFDVLHEAQAPGRGFAFLGQGGQLLLTLWAQAEGRFERDRPGLHHLSFQVEGLERVREVEARVRARGATFLHDGVVSHAEGAPSGGIFFEDPDGTRLEVYTPAGAEGHAPATPGAPSCGFF